MKNTPTPGERIAAWAWYKLTHDDGFFATDKLAAEIDQAIADAVREAKTVDVEKGARAISGYQSPNESGNQPSWRYCMIDAIACAEAWGLIAKEK